MRMTNKQFSQELIKWAVKFGLKNFYFNRDDTQYYAASVGQMKDGKPYLSYNLSSIREYGEDWYAILFHEFGHIINKHYLIKHTNLMERVKREYQAELFAYKTIKKYFPKRAKEFKKRQLEMIMDDDWGTRWPVHQEAFRRVYCK